LPTGGGGFAIAFSDSEPAKQFMTYLATSDAAAVGQVVRADPADQDALARQSRSALRLDTG